ncbi:glycosyltransferase family 92 protein F13G3.3-like [Rhinophrynus dorsalis]
MLQRRTIASFLVMVFLISTYYHRTQLSENKMELRKGNITPLSDNKTFIITPYYDIRGTETLRTIAIVHHKDVTDLYCLFFCSTSQGGTAVKAQVEIHSDRCGFPYGTADILCPKPPSCSPNYVAFFRETRQDNDPLTVFEIKNLTSQIITSNFTVCISTMFGNYSNLLLFIQSLEMYKILGAQKVTVYRNNCSDLMDKALQYYRSEGFIEIVDWPIDSYLNVSTKWHYSFEAKDIGYYGQIAALNDCVYRNMYSSRFLLLNDLDEIILPVKYQDWNKMMEALEVKYPGAGVFLFDNHVFPRTVFDSHFNITQWQSLPGDNILQHIYREPMPNTPFNNRKMIINPRKVIQTSVHFILKATAQSVQIKSDIALLHHCRDPIQTSLNRTSLINDTRLWDYSEILVQNVNKVIQVLTAK